MNAPEGAREGAFLFSPQEGYPPSMKPTFHIRPAAGAADDEDVVGHHVRFYQQAWGFDPVIFGGYVRSALEEIHGEGRLWVAERAPSAGSGTGEDEFAGCVGVAARPGNEAQLRLFLVPPACSGRGVGKVLLAEALTYCCERGFGRVYLWTFHGLDAAAHLYSKAGFRLTESVTHPQWGQVVTEERYDLEL